MASLLTQASNPFAKTPEEEEEARRIVAPNPLVAAAQNELAPVQAQPMPTGRIAEQAVPELAAEAWGTYNWRPEFRAQGEGLFQQEANLGRQYEQSRASAEQNYSRNLDDTTRMQEQARRALAERMAGQGAGFSSTNLDATTNQGNDFQRVYDDLKYNRDTGLTNLLSDFYTGVNSVRGRASGLMGEQQQVEEKERVEAARVAAEAEAERQRQRETQAMIDAIANQPPVTFNIGSAPGATTGAGGGGVTYRGGAGGDGSGLVGLGGLSQAPQAWDWSKIAEQSKFYKDNYKWGATDMIKKNLANDPNFAYSVVDAAQRLAGPNWNLNRRDANASDFTAWLLDPFKYDYQDYNKNARPGSMPL